MICAVMVLCTNATNDLIFRKASVGTDNRKLYSFYMLAALTSTVFSLGLGVTVDNGMKWDSTNLLFGLIMGVLSFITYFFFLLSFSGTNTSISVTIYRMNIVPGIILAVLFLNEELDFKRIISILLCLGCILLFGVVAKENGVINNCYKKSKVKYLYSIIALSAGGILNYVNKLAAIHNTQSFQLLFWRFLTVAIVSVAVIVIKKSWAVELKNAVLAVISGFVLMAGVWFMLKAFKTGDVAILLPITQLSFIPVSAVSGILYKEPISRKIYPGIIMAIIMIFLIN